MEVHLGKSQSISMSVDCVTMKQVVWKALKPICSFTCEIFQCDDSEKRFKKISDMKLHIENDHDDVYYSIKHAKQSRLANDEIDVTECSKYYFFDNI